MRAAFAELKRDFSTRGKASPRFHSRNKSPGKPGSYPGKFSHPSDNPGESIARIRSRSSAALVLLLALWLAILGFVILALSLRWNL